VGRCAELAAWVESVEGVESESGERLPIVVGGDVASIVRGLFNTKRDQLDVIAAELAQLVAVLDAEPQFINAYFGQAPTNTATTQLALDLLFENKYRKFGDIANADLAAEVAYGPEGFQEWLSAREAVQGVLAKFSPDSKQVLQGLISSQRPHLIRTIVTTLEELNAKIDTTANITVSSAVPLSDAQKAAIEAVLPNYIPRNKTSFTLAFNVTSDVVGGLILDIDNAIVDLSVATLYREASEDGSIQVQRA
jgi:ATP synthase delta (OSCP) subunit